MFTGFDGVYVFCLCDRFHLFPVGRSFCDTLLMSKEVNEREDRSETDQRPENRLTWCKVAVFEYTEVEGDCASSSGIIPPTAGLECPKT